MGCSRVWPSGHSSLKIRPPPPRRPPAKSRFAAAKWARSRERPPTVLTRGGHHAGADPGGALGRMRMEGWVCQARRLAVPRRGGVPLPPLLADHLSFQVPARPSPEDLRRSRLLAAAVCLAPRHLRSVGCRQGRLSRVRTQSARSQQPTSLWCTSFPRVRKAGLGRAVGSVRAGMTPEAALFFLLVSLFYSCLPVSYYE